MALVDDARHRPASGASESASMPSAGAGCHVRQPLVRARPDEGDALPLDAPRRGGQLDAEGGIAPRRASAARRPLRAVTVASPAPAPRATITPGLRRAAAVAAGRDDAVERRYEGDAVSATQPLSLPDR